MGSIALEQPVAAATSWRARAESVTLIPSRLVAVTRNASAFRTSRRSVPCHRSHVSCTTSSASAEPPTTPVGDAEQARANGFERRRVAVGDAREADQARCTSAWPSPEPRGRRAAGRCPRKRWTSRNGAARIAPSATSAAATTSATATKVATSASGGTNSSRSTTPKPTSANAGGPRDGHEVEQRREFAGVREVERRRVQSSAPGAAIVVVWSCRQLPLSRPRPRQGKSRVGSLVAVAARHAGHSCSEARCSVEASHRGPIQRRPPLTRATPSSASSARDGACGSRTTFTGPPTSAMKPRSALRLPQPDREHAVRAGLEVGVRALQRLRRPAPPGSRVRPRRAGDRRRRRPAR